MLKYILPLIPKHKIFVEPFLGGGAVFWAKEKSDVEVINDTNGEVINFYRVVKNNFRHLQKEIRSTLHSRKLQKHAKVIYQNPELFSSIQRAWAFWVLSNQSFGGTLTSGWKYAKDYNLASLISKKREAFTNKIKKRLEHVEIECNDALRVIESRDSAETLFYLDPPYFNADMGHYKGYTEFDFLALLKVLSKLKGNFILSSYSSPILKKISREQRWKTTLISRQFTVSHKKKKKTEVITTNF